MTATFTPRRAPIDGAVWVRHAALLLSAVVVLAPFAWMITTSLKTQGTVNTGPYFFPAQFEVGNYPHAWAAAPFPRYYLNTAIMTIGIVAGHLVLDTLAAYALARLRFRGRNAVFLALVGTMMIPSFLTILPAFDMVVRLGWFDSYAALIVPRLADVFGIIVIRGYFLTIPRELDEAARMDGAGHLRILTWILVPLARPALATVAVFSFLFAWNDFLWPLLVTADDRLRTIQLGLSAFQGKYAPQPHYLMAGTVTAAVPAIVLFLFLQRTLVRGLASTGVKE